VTVFALNGDHIPESTQATVWTLPTGTKLGESNLARLVNPQAAMDHLLASPRVARTPTK